MKINTLFLILIGFFSLSLCAAELQPYEIHYQTKAKGFNLKTVRKLEKKSAVFELSLVTNTVMMRTSETSTFNVDDTGTFIPLSYTYQRKIMGNNSTRQNEFFPAKKTATYVEKKSKPIQVSIPEEIYDVLSYHEKIRMMLNASGSGFTQHSFNVLERERVRQHVFKYSGTEQISTGLGNLDTVKIERVRENSSKKTTVWLAKNWGYVIVKIVHQEKDEPDYQLNIVDGTVDNIAITGKKTIPVVTD